MGRLTIPRFLREQWTTIPMPTTSARGKSIVVVGANVGLGFEAAKQIARLSPDRLLLTSRDSQKGAEAKKLIETQANVDHNISLSHLDLSSFDSVRSFVDELTNQEEKLDCLLANAAVATSKYVQTGDGWESTLQVNYLSTTLLSILLLPSLYKSSTPESASRLAIVSSDAHYLIRGSDVKDLFKSSNILATLNEKEYCTPSVMKQRYPFSKLLVVIFVRELAARLPQPTPVSVSAVNPGFCHSLLAREAESQFPRKWMMYVLKALFARSTEMGSRTLVHPAVEPGEREFHGHYVSICEVMEDCDLLLSVDGKKFSDQIWTETIHILGKIDPRVHQIISEYLCDPENETLDV